jgi:PASTA domain
VNVKPPKGAKAGSYGLQVRVTAEQDPDTDFVLGPVVAFALEKAPEKPKEPGKFPLWIIPVAAVLLIAVGVGIFFVVRGLGGGAQIVMPDLKGQDAQTAAVIASSLVQQEEGEQPVITLHDVSFVTARDPNAPPLSVLVSDPEAGKAVKPDQSVVLTIAAPSGACGTLLCMFPSAVFPAGVLQQLSELNFDGKYAEALSVVGGRVTVDAAKIEDIKNRQPPAPIVTVPDLSGLDYESASRKLASRGLSATASGVSEGPQDNAVLRTEPPAGTDVKKGDVVKVIYSRKIILDPCIRVTCFDEVPWLMFEDQVRTPQVMLGMGRDHMRF